MKMPLSLLPDVSTSQSRITAFGTTQPLLPRRSGALPAIITEFFSENDLRYSILIFQSYYYMIIINI